MQLVGSPDAIVLDAGGSATGPRAGNPYRLTAVTVPATVTAAALLDDDAPDGSTGLVGARRVFQRVGAVEDRFHAHHSGSAGADGNAAAIAVDVEARASADLERTGPSFHPRSLAAQTRRHCEASDTERRFSGPYGCATNVRAEAP